VFVFVNFATTVVNCRQINDNLRALLDGEGGVSDNSLVQDGSNAMSMIGKPANDDQFDLQKDLASFSEAGIGRDFKAKDDYDSSVTSLLHSFQTDDKNGNVFHHGSDDRSNENTGLGTLGL